MSLSVRGPGSACRRCRSTPRRRCRGSPSTRRSGAARSRSQLAQLEARAAASGIRVDGARRGPALSVRGRRDDRPGRADRDDVARPRPSRRRPIAVRRASRFGGPRTRTGSTRQASVVTVRSPAGPRLAREKATAIAWLEDPVPPRVEIPFVAGEHPLIVTGHDQDVGRLARARECRGHGCRRAATAWPRQTAGGQGLRRPRPATGRCRRRRHGIADRLEPDDRT